MAMDSRTERDRKTLEAIGCIYCHGTHSGMVRDANGLCPECRETVETTLQRTIVCPYGHVGNCQDCTLHCQRGDAQRRIKEMMRYAAPRMAVRHPLMTAEYLRKKLRGRTT